ncbi:MAG: DUF115 domain-containing protein [Deltaproteobacteria bacterium]|nr:DUF115 domain-containing protein [Deltaproteobacteria bacterium]
MGSRAFNSQRLEQNLQVLASVSPEVAGWLGEESHHLTLPPPGAWPRPCLDNSHRLCCPKGDEGGVTLVLGGGLLDEVVDLLHTTPAGRQVFVLEPRAPLLLSALGRHDLTAPLCEEELVLLAPEEGALELGLSRNPQLALTPRLEMLHLHLGPGDPQTHAAQARLYRLLGHARQRREVSLNWEPVAGANLLANLNLAALMGGARRLFGCLAGRPAILAAAGPGLGPALEKLAGRLAGAVFFSTAKALPQVLAAGILPSAAGLAKPTPGFPHPLDFPELAHIPLVAEETAHAQTLRSYPGPRVLTLGARGTALGPFAKLAGAFTPQTHALCRLAEMAAFAGCEPLILVGSELSDPEGELVMPAMDGGSIKASLQHAAAAGALARVLARWEVGALCVSRKGVAIPGVRAIRLEELTPHLGGPGQPAAVPPFGEEWLTAPELMDYAEGLSRAALAATRLWQRAAAPLADEPPPGDPGAKSWLAAADQLYMALADQSAADTMFSAFLDGCLVRSFHRRYSLACRGRQGVIRVEDASRELLLCLREMSSQAGILSQGLWEAAGRFRSLAQAMEDRDQELVAGFAQSLGREQLTPPW